MTREEIEVEAARALVALGVDPFIGMRWTRYDTVGVTLFGVQVYLDARCFNGRTFPDLVEMLATHIETYMQDKIHAQGA